MQKQPPAPLPLISPDDLAALSARAQGVAARGFLTSTAHFFAKSAPTVSVVQLMARIGLTRNKFEYRRRKNELPQGTENENGTRVFSLVEAYEWIQEYRSASLKLAFRKADGLPRQVRIPDSMAKAAIIGIANTSNSVLVATTAANIAQGLAIRGHRVLLIDLDPEAVLTSMYVDQSKVADENTVLGFLASGSDFMSFGDAVQTTYWPGVHIIAANGRISAAADALRSVPRDLANNVIHNGIDLDARLNYSAVILAAPSHSGLLQDAAISASNIVLAPVDATASGFRDAVSTTHLIRTVFADSKRQLNFLNVLPMVNGLGAESTVTIDMMRDAFGKHVMNESIQCGLEDKPNAPEVVYDRFFEKTAPKPIKVAIDTWERGIDAIEGQMHRMWKV